MGMKLFQSEAFKSNRYLIWGLTAFLIFTVAKGALPTVNQLKLWAYRTRTMNIEELRNRFHLQYRLQKELYDHIEKNTDDDTAVVIYEPEQVTPCNTIPFIAYFLSPRPVYNHSEPVLSKLAAEGKNFITVEITCEEKKVPPKWKILETAKIKASVNKK
jgi:hypothetical protein